MSNPTKEQILDGIRRSYRTMPLMLEIRIPNEQTMIWIGQTKVLLKQAHASIDSNIARIQSSTIGADQYRYYRDIKQELINTITNLEQETGGYAFAVDQGNVFDYFDETRKILASAKNEIFMVDPYATADLVSDYFTSIESNVAIRALISNRRWQWSQLLSC